MSESRIATLEKIGATIASTIKDEAVVGLGSGSTIASLLPSISRSLEKRRVGASWIPTSLQIELEAEKAGLRLTGLTEKRVDLAVDGADQIDQKLNMIKGGGGALLKEKAILTSSRRSIIVADEKKIAPRLCTNGTKVPVEIVPFARGAVARRLKGVGGAPALRLDQRSFPQYTENGNLILDTLFDPIEEPERLEEEIKTIPGVVEVGIFTVRPLEVFVIEASGGYRVVRRR